MEFFNGTWRLHSKDVGIQNAKEMASICLAIINEHHRQDRTARFSSQ